MYADNLISRLVFGAEVLVFTLVRKRFRAIYEPRTYLTAEGYVPLFLSLSTARADRFR